MLLLLIPEAIDVITCYIAPGTDTSLYIINGAQLPVYAKTVQGVFTQTIANGASITAFNVLTSVTRNVVAATTCNSTISMESQTGLTLNTGTGAVTLNSNTVAGTYTCNYKVADKNEPTVFVTGTITITVLD